MEMNQSLGLIVGVIRNNRERKRIIKRTHEGLSPTFGYRIRKLPKSSTASLPAPCRILSFVAGGVDDSYRCVAHPKVLFTLQVLRAGMGQGRWSPAPGHPVDDHPAPDDLGGKAA